MQKKISVELTACVDHCISDLSQHNPTVMAIQNT